MFEKNVVNLENFSYKMKFRNIFYSKKLNI